LEEKLTEETRSRLQIEEVVAEYEKTILGYIAEASTPNSSAKSIPEKVYEIENEIHRLIQEATSIDTAYKQLNSRIIEVDAKNMQLKKVLLYLRFVANYIE
jgi:hypothetical protein